MPTDATAGGSAGACGGRRLVRGQRRGGCPAGSGRRGQRLERSGANASSDSGMRGSGKGDGAGGLAVVRRRLRTSGSADAYVSAISKATATATVGDSGSAAANATSATEAAALVGDDGAPTVSAKNFELGRRRGDAAMAARHRAHAAGTGRRQRAATPARRRLSRSWPGRGDGRRLRACKRCQAHRPRRRRPTRSALSAPTASVPIWHCRQRRSSAHHGNIHGATRIAATPQRRPAAAPARPRTLKPSPRWMCTPRAPAASDQLSRGASAVAAAAATAAMATARDIGAGDGVGRGGERQQRPGDRLW